MSYETKCRRNEGEKNRARFTHSTARFFFGSSAMYLFDGHKPLIAILWVSKKAHYYVVNISKVLKLIPYEPKLYFQKNNELILVTSCQKFLRDEENSRVFVDTSTSSYFYATAILIADPYSFFPSRHFPPN